MKYYLVNTNRKADPSGYDENIMLKEEIVSLYFEHYKQRINNLDVGDVVFLYSNGNGIIAYGEVCSETLVRDYRSNKSTDEEYYKKLKDFKKLHTPVTVQDITDKLGKKMPVAKAIAEVNNEFASCILYLANNHRLSLVS